MVYVYNEHEKKKLNKGCGPLRLGRVGTILQEIQKAINSNENITLDYDNTTGILRILLDGKEKARIELARKLSEFENDIGYIKGAKVISTGQTLSVDEAFNLLIPNMSGGEGSGGNYSSIIFCDEEGDDYGNIYEEYGVEDIISFIQEKIGEFLSSFAITTENIANGSITDIKLANNTVTNSKIANNTITNAKLAELSKFMYGTNNAGSSHVQHINEITRSGVYILYPEQGTTPVLGHHFFCTCVSDGFTIIVYGICAGRWFERSKSGNNPWGIYTEFSRADHSHQVYKSIVKQNHSLSANELRNISLSMPSGCNFGEILQCQGFRADNLQGYQSVLATPYNNENGWFGMNLFNTRNVNLIVQIAVGFK